MRIKTKNKIVEVSNIEYDEGRCIIYTDEFAIIIDDYITFTEYLKQLLTHGYADLSSYKEI